MPIFSSQCAISIGDNVITINIQTHLPLKHQAKFEADDILDFFLFFRENKS